jgi:hypothetical protein
MLRAETFGRGTEKFGGDSVTQLAALEDARDALVTDLEAPRPHLVSNSPQRPSLAPHDGDFSDSLLLSVDSRLVFGPDL